MNTADHDAHRNVSKSNRSKRNRPQHDFNSSIQGHRSSECIPITLDGGIASKNKCTTIASSTDDCQKLTENESSRLDDEDTKVQVLKGSGKLSLFQFVCYAFTLTAGGPFGLEPAVRSGGPLATMIALILVPFLYTTPQVMLITELTTMMPTNEGYVLWIDVALGPILSYVVALMNAILNVCDLSLYTKMSTTYITTYFFPSFEPLWVNCLSLVPLTLGFLVALFEIDVMATVSAWIAILSVAPFIFGFFWRVPDLRLWQLEIQPRRFDPALFYSTVVWMFSGWSAIGNIGGEGRTAHIYSVGLFITIILDVLVYLLPLLAALTVDARGEWLDGSLGGTYELILPHLGAVCAVACSVASFGMLVTSLACYSRALVSLSVRGWIPRFFSKTRKNSTVPLAATTLMVVITACMLFFDLEFAMLLDVTINVFSLIVIHIVYGVLWKTRPDIPRPFMIPGGTFGRVLTLLLSGSVMVSVFVINSMSDTRVIQTYLVMLVLFGVCGYFVTSRQGVNRC